MKRIVLMIFASLVLTTAQAQQDTPLQLRFGYLSYDSVLVAMPGYALVKNTLANMRSQYEAEMKRVEQDFNLKYEEFLEGQRDFPETILLKRQNELQNMLESNAKFRIKVQN